MGPPVSPEVIGRLQGIEPNPFFDPLTNALRAYSVGYPLFRSAFANLGGEVVGNLTGSRDAAAAVPQLFGLGPNLRSYPTDPAANLATMFGNLFGGPNNRFGQSVGNRVYENAAGNLGR